MAESSHIFFTKAQCFVDIESVYKKVDSVPFQIMYYSYLYDQKW